MKMKAILLISTILLELTCGGLLSSSKHAFKADDPLNLRVNGLHSLKTLIPYDYYYLPFPKVLLWMAIDWIA